MHRLLFIFIWLFTFIQGDAQETVYICSSSTYGKFHVNRNCGGLKNCGGFVKAISLHKAKKDGHGVCKRCSNSFAVSTPIDKNVTPKNTNANELAKTKKGIKSQIISHIGFTSSYNSNWLIPNWVAYNLTKNKVNGSISRPKRAYEPDPLVTGKCAEHKDYSNSGYTRGHMAPAADMKWSIEAMNESFYLSNICPQIAELNGGIWEKLEKRIRALATESTVYICCGPIVSQSPTRIGENRIAVPEKFFKVICMQRRGKWQAIGFIFPNTDCKGSMFDYATSVDDIELLTGHNFFFNLQDDIEDDIESTWLKQDWQ